MPYSSDWRPCLQSAESLVARAKWRGAPVWIDASSRSLQRQYPNSGLDISALATILRALVIERGGCLAP